MSVLNKQICLVLNNLWLPIGYNSVRKGIVALLSENNGEIAAKAIDLDFSKKEDGSWDYDNPIYYNPVTWDEWVTLPVREYDEIIRLSKNRIIRAPTVIIACNCSKIILKELKPTKKNIIKKYGNRCIFSNKVLDDKQLSIDHLIPKSRGGTNDWYNLAPCDKKLNSEKGSKTVEEFGKKLCYTVSKPNPSPYLIAKCFHPTWRPFLTRIDQN